MNKKSQPITCCLVYVTVENRAEALRLGRVAVEERLAACANVLGSVDSVYRWEGKICEGKEVVLLLKTTDARRTVLMDRIVALHPYDYPAVVSIPLVDGHQAFLKWIHEETDAGTV